jgi:hypothetical protein
MRARQVAVVVGNGAVLIATNVVFRAWVDRTLGHLDLDMIGLSGASWPLVVLLAIASAWLAFHVPVARMTTAVLTLILAFIVVDHAFGALRDGEISMLGMVTGALMVLQVLMLVGSILLASRSGARVARAGIGLTFGVALALVLGGAVTFARVSGPAPQEAAVRHWLHAAGHALDERCSAAATAAALRG